MADFVSFDEPAKPFVDFSKPEEPISLLTEIPRQLYAGATIDLPKMVGQAMEWLGDGKPMQYRGTELVNTAARREYENQGLAPQTEGRGLIGRALSAGARALAPSLSMMVPAAVAAPFGAVAAGAAAGAGAFGLFGASQAQETYDKLVKDGVDPEQAKTAGYINLLIEGGGETLGTMAGVKLFGIGAKALGKMSPVQSAIKSATTTEILKPFAKQLPQTLAIEMGTEFGQNAGEAAIERAYGGKNAESPWVAGWHGAEAALGMTMLLAPFGLAGFAARARSNARVAGVLEDPEADPIQRTAAARLIYADIEKVDPAAAKVWSENSTIAIVGKAPIVLDESFAQPKPRQDAIASILSAGSAEADLGANVDATIEAAAQATSEPVSPEARIQPSPGLISSTLEQQLGNIAQDADAVRSQVEKETQLDAIQAARPGPTAMQLAMQEAKKRAQADEQERLAREQETEAKAQRQAAMAAEQTKLPQAKELPILNAINRREPVSDADQVAVTAKGFAVARPDGTLRLTEAGFKARNRLTRQEKKDDRQEGVWIPSEVLQGQEPVQAGTEQRAGEETPAAGRILQAQGPDQLGNAVAPKIPESPAAAAVATTEHLEAARNLTRSPATKAVIEQELQERQKPAGAAQPEVGAGVAPPGEIIKPAPIPSEPEAAKGLPPPAAALPTTAVVPKQRLFVKAIGNTFEVESIEDASRKWEEFRDRTKAGVSQIGNGVRVVDQTGKGVARISYNGRVWGPGESKTGDKPIYTPPEQAARRAEAKAGPLASEAAPVETFAGKYGKGMNLVPAQQKQAEFSKKRPELEWKVEPSNGLDYPHVVVGYAKNPEARSEPALAESQVPATSEPGEGGVAPTTQAALPEVVMDDPVHGGQVRGIFNPEFADIHSAGIKDAQAFWNKDRMNVSTGRRSSVPDGPGMPNSVTNIQWRLAFVKEYRRLMETQSINEDARPTRPSGAVQPSPLSTEPEQPPKVGKKLPAQKREEAKAREAVAPETAADLQRFGREAGWKERGGRIIREGETGGIIGNGGAVVGRTKWIPKQAWFQRMRQDLGNKGLSGERDIQKAVDAHLAGNRLSPIQQRTVDWMLAEIQSERESFAAEQQISDDLKNDITPADLAEAGLEVTGQEEAINDLMASAVETDDAATERAAIQFEGDDAGLISELKRIINHEQKPETTRPGTQDRAEAQPLLTQPTPADLKASAEAEQAAADQKAKDEAAAEKARAGRKVTADQTDMFNFQGGLDLTRSEPDTGEAIEDFGEKIAGARKDYATKLAEAKDADIAAVPLSKSWPEPDYQKLLDGKADPWSVAFAHAARDEVPTKPHQSWKLARWVAQVEMLRDTTMKLISGELSTEKALALLADEKWKALRAVADRAELYTEVGHNKSLKGIRIASGQYSVFNGVEYKPAKVIWSVERKAVTGIMNRFPKMMAHGNTRVEAIANFKKSWLATTPEPDASRAIDFQLYSKRDTKEIFIGKKIGAHVAELRGGFTNVKEARAWKDANQAELVTLLERYKKVPYERKETNSPRIGVDHRNGANVTPERFTEAFEFRGVQFGNYVEGSRRQADLNETYDALMDLAGVLDIPPKALSLNGELGLAFGARGTGGKQAPSAHYEPGQVVINLTKARGAGSLAHEWFHGVDNYFSRMGGNKAGYLTEAQAVKEGVRPEMVAAFKQIMAAIRATGLPQRSGRLDQTRSKPYWQTRLEMAARSFEAYIVAKLQDQSASNDYLANIVSEDYWEAATALGMEKDNTFPYPTTSEMTGIRAAFDRFFQTVETRETDKGVAMFAKGTGTGITEQTLRAEIAKAFGPRAERMVGDLLTPLQTQAEIAEKLPDVASYIKSGDVVQGFHMSGKAYAVLENIAPEQVRGFVLHEIGVHHGLEGMLGADRYAQILRQMDMMRRAGNKAVIEAYAQAEKQAATPEQIPDERIAYLVTNRPELPFVKRLIAEIKAFLFRKFGILGDRLTVDDIAALARASVLRASEGVKNGEPQFQRGPMTRKEMIMSDREYVRNLLEMVNLAIQARDEAAARGDTAKAEFFDKRIDEHRRELKMLREQEKAGLPLDTSGLRAPEFSRTQDQTQTPEFKRWFGDSKVVDAEGKPLRVYHGTARDVNAFDMAWRGTQSDSGFYGPGFYFSSGPTEASAYAMKRGGQGANVIPAFISLQNPLVLDTMTHEAATKTFDRVKKMGGEMNFSGFAQNPDQFGEAARKAGYDGIIAHRSDRASTEVIAFRPEQIKSAIGNTGAFDPGNPDIRFARNLAQAIPQLARNRLSEIADYLIYNYQDKFHMLPRIQKALHAGALPEGMDANLAVEAYPKKVAAKVQDFHDDYVKPFVKLLHDNNLTIAQAEEYVNAKDASDRNREMKARNPTKAELDAMREDLAAKRDALAGADAVQEFVAKRRELRQAEADVEDGIADQSAVEVLQGEIAALRKDKGVKDYAAAIDKLKALRGIQPFDGDNTALSGMSDDQAAAVLAKAKQDGTVDALERVSAAVDAITVRTRQVLLESGLAKSDEIAAWEELYPHYVPRFRDEVDGTAHPIGQGFQVRGKESKRATGSTKEVTNILAHVMAAHEAAIIRAEKVKADRALYAFLAAHPDNDVAELDVAPKIRDVDAKTGLVIERVDPLYKNKPNVLVLKIDGDERTITFNENNPEALRLAASLKNLSAQDIGEITAVVGKFTRFLATMNTAANPVFTARNFMRDVGTAFVNLTDTELADAKKQVFADIPKAIRGFWSMTRGSMDSEWSKLAREFRDAGGQTGFVQHYKDIIQRAETLEKQLADMQPGKVNFTKELSLKYWHLIEDANLAMENGVRLSAYVNARKAGLSEAKAISLSNNLTVNFTKHGSRGQELNMWYMFMNASIQGTARLVKAMGNRNVQKILGFVIASAFLLDMLNRGLAGDDDDDGENDYDQLPDYTKANNFVFYFGRPITIPMPYGYNFFASVGRMTSEAIFRKNYSPAKSAVNLATVFLDAFSPMGQSGSLLQFAAPTIADPFIQWAENKNFAGNPMRREQLPFGVPKPEYQMGFKSTSAPAKALAEALNDITGGNEVRAGLINMNPAAFDFAVTSILGGAGRTYLQAFSLPVKAALGEEIQAREVPVANIFASAKPEYQTERKFIENLRAVQTVSEELKHYRSDPKQSALIREQHSGEVRLIGQAKTMQTVLERLRKQERLLEKNKGEGWRERERELEERKRALMSRFNKRYVELTAQ